MEGHAGTSAIERINLADRQAVRGHKQTVVAVSELTSKPVFNGTALLRPVVSQSALN